MSFLEKTPATKNVQPSRRETLKGAAWAVPVIAFVATAPAAAASTCTPVDTSLVNITREDTEWGPDEAVATYVYLNPDNAPLPEVSIEFSVVDETTEPISVTNPQNGEVGTTITLLVKPGDRVAIRYSGPGVNDLARITDPAKTTASGGFCEGSTVPIQTGNAV